MPRAPLRMVRQVPRGGSRQEAPLQGIQSNNNIFGFIFFIFFILPMFKGNWHEILRVVRSHTQFFLCYHFIPLLMFLDKALFATNSQSPDARAPTLGGVRAVRKL